MNRHDFMAQLKNRLKKLPEEEAFEALQYYEQYFDDAGAENEEAVLKELGSPAAVAAQIVADFAVKTSDVPVDKKASKNGLSTVLLVILAVFASPIALPLALAFVVVIIALLIVILAVLLSIGVTGIALIAGGLFTISISIPLFLQSFPTALFYLGAGLLVLGMGVPATLGTVALAKRSFRWLSGVVGSFILKRRAAQ